MKKIPGQIIRVKKARKEYVSNDDMLDILGEGLRFIAYAKQVGKKESDVEGLRKLWTSVSNE